MRRLRSIVILSGLVLIVIPGAILWLSGLIHIGWGLGKPLNLVIIIFGWCLIILGTAIIGYTIKLFIPRKSINSPISGSSEKLIVGGIYGYTRNPMIVGMSLFLMGEVILFGSIALFIWFMIFLVVNLIYLPLSEEPELEKRFGEEYSHYKESVPRWLPRHSAWERPLFPEEEKYS